MIKNALTVDDVAGRLTLTIPEAGRLIGICRESAYAAAARGEIPTVSIGRRLLVPTARLLALLGVEGN